MIYTAKDAKLAADKIEEFNEELKIIEQKIYQQSQLGYYNHMFTPIVSKQTEKVLKDLGYKVTNNKKANNTLISWKDAD